VLTLEEAMTFGIGKSAPTLAAAVEQTFGRTLSTGFTEGMCARIMNAFGRTPSHRRDPGASCRTEAEALCRFEQRQ
jgi:hypothetical protein